VSVRFISLNDPPTPDPSKSIFLFFSLILFLQILFSQKGSLRSLGSLLLFIEILKYQLILKWKKVAYFTNPLIQRDLNQLKLNLLRLALTPFLLLWR
jgi:hypothetical protein